VKSTISGDFQLNIARKQTKLLPLLPGSKTIFQALALGMNLNMSAVDILPELEKNLSKNVDTEFWDKSKSAKMSDKSVLAKFESPALGFPQNNSDIILNSALVMGIITKKGKLRDLHKKKDNLEDLKKAKFARRLLISIVKMMDLSWDDTQGMSR
jgi:hypothetical protein